MFGYAGSVVIVDLSKRKILKEPLDLEKARSFLGGFGLNHRFAYDFSKPGVDPLSPDNPVVLGAGPLVGTSVPGAVKIFATTKLPLNEAFGSPAGSMNFANMLKWAGYDHVIITGASERPTYLKIIDDDVELCDAGDLWGKDILESTHELKKQYGDASGVICIGQAGENLVKTSLSLVDAITTLGRGGLGAVMGSKKLKAIVAYGTRGINIAQVKRFTKAVDSLRERMINFKGREAAVDLGVMGGWDMLIKTYFSTEVLTEQEAAEIYGPGAYKKTKSKRMACPSCMLGDKDVLEMKEGQFKGLVMPETSFINVPALGTRFAIRDLSQAGYLFNLLDRYGLCGQTLEGLFEFVILLYEHGLITREDADGLELRRDFETVKALIEKTARREGLGDTLAEGWTGVIKRFGKECEAYAYITKGINFLWDPRLYCLGTMQFEGLVSPRGPYSAYGGSFTPIPGLSPDAMKRQCDRVGVSKEQIERIFDSAGRFNVGRLTRYYEDWVSLLNAMGICNRGAIDRYYSAAICAELYSAATGIEMSREEMVKAAERSWNLSRAINVREGLDRKDDRIPPQWFEPLKTADGQEHVMRDYYNTKTLTKEDVLSLLDDYYEERGWDIRTGIPTKEKLIELGLADVARDLAKGH